MKTLITSRIGRIQRIMTERKAHGFLVTSSTNIRYLTGFHGIAQSEREAILLATRKSAYLFVPEMYEVQAKTLPLFKNKSLRLVVTKERNTLFDGLKKNIQKNPVILFESSNLTVSELNQFRLNIKAHWKDAGNMVEELRMIKDADEIKMIRKAVRVTDKTLWELVRFLKRTDYTRLTELDLVERIRNFSRKLQGDGFGFDPIIASGTGSAEPHYKTRNKKLKKGTLLLIDLGITYKGYTGDLTRCLFLGRASKKIKEMYGIVLECNKSSIKKCKPGISAEKLHAHAQEYFRTRKLNKYFLHGLGHSIGLDIHESPSLRPKDKTKLEPNMTLTIEPGLYFENKFGIRIEDAVLVTKTGCEVLSQSQKELIEIL